MPTKPRTHTPPSELPEKTEEFEAPVSHQRGPRTDPSMRDGNSSHGNPYEMEGNEPSTDNDTGDVEDEPVHAGFEGGATEGTVGTMRGDVETTDFTLRLGEHELNVDELDDLEDTPLATDPLPHPGVEAGADGSTIGKNPPARTARRSKAGQEDAGAANLPIDRYPELTAVEVLERAESLRGEERRRVREFEAAHRNRKTLLAKLDRLIGRGGQRIVKER